MKRQVSLLSFPGFGQELGSSAPYEKRPAVDSECTEAGPSHSETSSVYSIIISNGIL